MNLIFLIGFGYFCFNQVILTSTGKIDNGNIPEEIFKSIELPSYEHTDHKTQLMNLNDDCLILVLDQLDLNSLLSLAETNNQFKSLVSVILKQIFRKKMVTIDLSRPSEKIWSTHILISGDYIEITSVTVAERVLKNFGHLIQKLQLRRNYRASDDSHRSIYKLVNLHCSKTLKEIWLENSVNNFLNEFTNQFENVQNVFIRDSLETDRCLNEIFPSVRRLDFLILRISNTNSINVNYANLEHLELFINVNGSPLTEELAAELIGKNSYIRSLALELASADLVKIAADSLPQLERLKLKDIQCKQSNESISLANVKIFETNGCCVKCLFLNIKFGNVEELYTDDLAESMFGETGFLASNTKLKKLQLVSDYEYYNIDALKKLAHANSTLQDIFISRVAWVEVETILQFLENNKQLEKLKIIFFTINNREFISKVLSKKIGDEWTMKAFLGTIILKKEHILF